MSLLTCAKSVVQVTIYVVLFLLFLIYMRHGGGKRFPDRTAEHGIRDAQTDLKVIATLDLPPGNVAVSSSGRVYFSHHPDAWPATKIAQVLDDGSVAPFPSQLYQSEHLNTVLSVRVGRLNGDEVLWALDYALHGIGTPTLFAFRLNDGVEVRRHRFSPAVAPLGSMLNDFAVDETRNMLYIADASVLRNEPSIVIYSIDDDSARRVLVGDERLYADYYTMHIGDGGEDDSGRRMVLLGVFSIRPHIDSIALNADASYLYFAPVTEEHMYRVPVDALVDVKLDGEQLAERVETFARNKTMSDGIIVLADGSVLVSDPEHSAIVQIAADGASMTTLFKHVELLRWPDGFAQHGNTIYVTCSALQHVFFHEVNDAKPFQIFSFEL
jgi:Major royal jelly protein